MISSLIFTIIISSILIASIGYSYTQRDIHSRFIEDEEMTFIEVYFLHPCVYLWSLIEEVFTWTKIGVMMALSLEYRENVVEEGLMFIDEEEDVEDDEK